MTTTRTPISTAGAWRLDDLKARARVDCDYSDMELAQLADTAAAEIEAHCGLALLAQSVTVTLRAWCKDIPLPVGPFWSDGLPDHPITVELVDLDGTRSVHPAGWWIEGERYPVLHLTAPVHGAALIITYPAGYGMKQRSIPADLQLAISDHAAMMYDIRALTDAPQGLSVAAARIAARHRKVAV
jgi:uncharacterized phiE125 gp8 family phage protein